MSMKALIFTLAMAVIGSGAHAITIIDNFDTNGTTPASEPAGTPGAAADATFFGVDDFQYEEGLDPAQTLGGNRLLVVDSSSGTGATTFGAVNTTIPGLAALANGQGSGDLFLRYGVDEFGVLTMASQLDEDFMFLPGPWQNRIQMLVTSDAPGLGGILSVTLTSGFDTISETTFTVTRVIDVFGPKFYKFVDLEFVGIDFSDIDYIEVSIDGNFDGDYTIDFLAGVPEPASASLLVLGALGLMGRRRRQS